MQGKDRGLSEGLLHPGMSRKEAIEAPARLTRHAVRIAGLVLLVAVVGLVGYGFWPSLVASDADSTRPDTDEAPASAPRIAAMVVTPQPFVLRAEATGHLAPWRRAEVSAEASGRIVERPIEEGHQVQEGAVLLALDAREQRIAVQEAEAELLRAQAEYAVASNQGRPTGETVSDSTHLAGARERYQQAKAAYASGHLSEAEWRAAQRRFDAANVLTGAQRGAVQAVIAGVAQAEQHLERAQLMLDRMTIRAPFTGRIADLTVELGQRIGVGQVICLLLDDAQMKVEVDVLEADMVHIAVGSTANIRVPSLDQQVFRGTVFAINPSIDPQTGTGRITVAVPNRGQQLVPGMFAYVALETRRLQARLAVPSEAVLVRQGRDLVFRVREGRAEWVYVTVGERSGDWVEVLDGVAAGDTLAVDGHFALAHDSRIEVGEVLPLLPE